MSLAIYAERLDNDDNQDNMNSIGRKRNANNKTQKRTPSYPKENNYSEKVNSVLQKIYSSNNTDESDGLADFKPIPPPTSAGVQATISREKVGDPKFNDSVNGFTNMYSDLANQQDETMNKDHDYYKQFVPNYQDMYKGFQGQSQPQPQPYGYTGYSTTPYVNGSIASNPSKSQNDILLDKLNYMIHLLEEQQDERTNNVTEEVILYSFLGIFIIFIVDSFARVGKYTR
jgi:hypothetical protein